MPKKDPFSYIPLKITLILTGKELAARTRAGTFHRPQGPRRHKLIETKKDTMFTSITSPSRTLSQWVPKRLLSIQGSVPTQSLSHQDYHYSYHSCLLQHQRFVIFFIFMKLIFPFIKATVVSSNDIQDIEPMVTSHLTSNQHINIDTCTV